RIHRRAPLTSQIWLPSSPAAAHLHYLDPPPPSPPRSRSPAKPSIAAVVRQSSRSRLATAREEESGTLPSTSQTGRRLAFADHHEPIAAINSPLPRSSSAEASVRHHSGHSPPPHHSQPPAKAAVYWLQPPASSSHPLASPLLSSSPCCRRLQRPPPGIVTATS
ncbi:hypothetical protein Dimus_030289, partial [Dionaea muscipula]